MTTPHRFEAMIHCPVLTYHSHNVFANEYGKNDHVSLARDLRTIQAMGKRIIGLGQLLDWLLGEGNEAAIENGVCLTFDDGCDFDVFDLDFSGHGIQRSFLNILKDFQAEFGIDAQPDLQATSFVMAGPEARAEMDRRSLFGRSWISDGWWAPVQAKGLIDIQNHSWDHNHPDVTDPTHPEKIRGRFDVIDSFEACELQVRKASEYIGRRAGKEQAELFAYPYGQSSRYLREIYFPRFTDRHHTRAAFGCDAGAVTRDSNRWNLPRFICIRDWKTPDQFRQLLEGLL